ncbi:uncharacterized protein LOC128216518 [Mya arenaria]|uniref:uncharacterized protein LOC128216518 n=1 Tax=Mya arenaria TaxID=6604 RepID=UPI0022E10153|nr:uncharacterized protein LOC128216518 [Mya arenaria]
MTFDENMNKFTHEVEEAFHDVEEVFRDVKDHMILSVRNHSYMIALFLMSLTSAILVFGTIYVWCFHRGHPYREDYQHIEEKNETEAADESANDQMQHKKKATSAIPRASPASDVTANNDVSDQDGKVRKRVPSSSGSSMNNNDSPVKSKIPVRRQTSKQS